MNLVLILFFLEKNSREFLSRCQVLALFFTVKINYIKNICLNRQKMKSLKQNNGKENNTSILKPSLPCSSEDSIWIQSTIVQMLGTLFVF